MTHRYTIGGLDTIEVLPFGPARQLALASLVPAARAVTAWVLEIRERGLRTAPLMVQLSLRTAGPAMALLEPVLVDPARMCELLATTRVQTDDGWFSLISAGATDRVFDVFDGREGLLIAVAAAALHELLVSAPGAPMIIEVGGQDESGAAEDRSSS